MKILLVVKSKAIETLGPQYLSAVIRQAGHDPRIVALNEAFQVAMEWRPQMIGYSVLTGDQQKFIDLNNSLRQQFKFGALFGGPHASFWPDDFGDEAAAIGESEQDIADLLNYEVKYSSIDDIPWPDRSSFPNMPIRDFLASRGCANSCAYCYNSSWNEMFPEYGVRIRDPKDVVAEIASTSPRFAYMQDSCFGIKMKWLKEFSEEYRAKVNVPYHCHLRPRDVTEERVLLLHDSNCVSVKIALETASDRLRKLINRGAQKNEDVYTAAKWLKKWGIKLILQNILGLPSASIEDDLFTLKVNIKAQPAYAWTSIFQPYPKTALAKWCEAEGLYTGDYSEIGDNFFDKSVLNISNLHKEQVACLQRIFAFCVEMQVMPKVEDLTWERLPKFIHDTMRKAGDSRMFPGVL